MGDNWGMTALAPPKPRTAAVGAWLERFRLAWEHGDAGDWVEDAFTEDARFHHHPLRPPQHGHAEIRQHLRRAGAILGDAEIHMGEPIVAGDRAAAEWWAQTTDGTHEVTMTGTLVLRFAPDGRCEELRRYGDMQPGRYVPFPVWTS
jgi:hypothetical protein